MTTEYEDHDQRLKTAIKTKFSDAIDLMLPAWLPLFLFHQLEWLEQEIFEDPPEGQRRAVDLVAKIPTTEPLRLSEQEPAQRVCLSLVHLELEGRDPLWVMRERMQNYRHHLKKKYGLPVLPLCIYRHVNLEGQGWDTLVTIYCRLQSAGRGAGGADANSRKRQATGQSRCVAEDCQQCGE